MFIKGISFYFVAKGYNVDVSFSGEDAMRRIDQKEYDLIITDVVLPKISGITVTSLIKHRMSTPVMVMSSMDEEEFKYMPKSKEPDGFMQKLLNLSALNKQIEVLTAA